MQFARKNCSRIYSKKDWTASNKKILVAYLLKEFENPMEFPLFLDTTSLGTGQVVILETINETTLHDMNKSSIGKMALSLLMLVGQKIRIINRRW